MSVPQRRRKYRFADHTQIQASDVQPIVELLREGRREEAQQAFDALMATVKDIKHFEAFHLALKITEESQVVDQSCDVLPPGVAV